MTAAGDVALLGKLREHEADNILDLRVIDPEIAVDIVGGIVADGVSAVSELVKAGKARFFKQREKLFIRLLCRLYDLFAVSYEADVKRGIGAGKGKQVAVKEGTGA